MFMIGWVLFVSYTIVINSNAILISGFILNNFSFINLGIYYNVFYFFKLVFIIPSYSPFIVDLNKFPTIL
jgi:hypothetical protein